MRKNVKCFFAIMLSIILIVTMFPLSAFADTTAEGSNNTANGMDEKKSSTEIAQELKFSGAEPFTKDVTWDPLQVRERVEEVGLFKDCLKITPVQMYMHNGNLLQEGTKPSTLGKEYKREFNTSQATNILNSPEKFSNVSESIQGTPDFNKRYSSVVRGEMPSAMTAGDIDGDGVEEILWYHIVISDENGKLVSGDAKSIIEKFNKGAVNTKDRLTATYQLDIIRPVFKDGEDKPSSYNIETYNPPNYKNVFHSDSRRIPTNMLEWSSFISIIAFDIDGDGCDEIAASAISSCGIIIYDIIGSSGGMNLGCTEVPLKFTPDINTTNRSSYVSLDSGDLNGDGIEDLAFSYTVGADDTDVCSIYGSYYQESPSSYKSIALFARGKVDNSSTFNMVNCGVTVGDINNDGINELVLGGAAKGSSDVKYTLPNPSGEPSKAYEVETEMTLLAMKLNQDKFEQVAVTILRDNEDLFANIYGGDTRYNWSTNATERMNNFSSWYIPTKAVSFTGMKNGKNWDQIYFGNHIYYLDALNTFRIYDDSNSAKNAPKFYDDFDSNRVSVIAVEASPAFIDPSLDAFSGREQLIIYYMKDAKNYDYGFSFTTLYENPESKTEMDIQKTAACLGEYANYKSCDLYPLMAFFEPGGKDLSYAYQLTGKERVISEPQPLALLSAPPTFKDYIESQTQNGMTMYDPGSTAMEEKKGTSSGTGSESSYSVGPAISFELSNIMSLDGSFMYEHGEGVNDEFTKSSSFTVSTTNNAEDVVALTAVPIDVYYYNAYIPNLFKKYMDGSVNYGSNADYPGTDPNWTPLQTAIPAEAQTKATTVNVYNEYAKKYGKHVFEYGTGKDLPYILGDPSSYPSFVADYGNLKDVYIHDKIITSSTDTGNTTVSFGMDEAHTKEWSNGLDADVSFTIFGIGVGMGMGAMKTNSKTDISGHTFTSRFTYLPEEYSTSNKVFIAKKTITETDSSTGQKITRDIPFMGYLKETAIGRPKLPQNIVQSNLNNLSSSAISISYDVPAVVGNEIKADHYELYRFDTYQNCWILISANLPNLPGQTNTYIDENDLAPNMECKYKFIATKSSKMVGANPTGDVSTFNEITVGPFKTKPIYHPPIITENPKDVTVVAGENALFTIGAQLPEGRTGEKIRYDWYYSPKGSESHYRVFEQNGTTGVLLGANARLDAGKNLLLQAVPADLDGYRFACKVGRLENNEPVSVNSSYATLTVLKEAPKRFKVEYNADSNGLFGSVSCLGMDGKPIKSGDTALQNTTLTFLASPKSGQKVKSWTVNGKEALDATGNVLEDSQLIINNLQGDTKVNVSFKDEYCELKFAAEGNGTVSAQAPGVPLQNGSKYPSGTPVSLIAKADEGYMLSHYLKYDPNSGAWKTVTDKDGHPVIKEECMFELSSDLNVKAVFTQSSTLSLSYTEKEREGVASMRDSILKVSVNNGIPIELRNGQTLPDIKPGSRVKLDITPGNGSFVYGYVLAPENGEPIKQITKATSYEIPSLSGSCDISVYFQSYSTNVVNFDASGDGIVTANIIGNSINSGNEVRYGSTVQFQAVANKNQMFTGWTVNGAEVDNEGRNTLTLTIEKNTNVNANFAPLLDQQKMSEEDVKKILIEKFGEGAGSKWSPEKVQKLIESGVLQNLPNKETDPKDNVKRGWLAEVVKNMSNGESSVDGSEAAKFKDLKPTDEFANAIKWCAENGYMKGMTDGTFRPEESITREQLAVTLVNYIDKQGLNIPEDTPINYTDADEIGKWAKDAVDRATAMGVFKGNTDGEFNPKDTATVEECSAAIMQMTENVIPETIPQENTEFPAPDQNTEAIIPEKEPEESTSDIVPDDAPNDVPTDGGVTNNSTT